MRKSRSSGVVGNTRKEWDVYKSEFNSSIQEDIFERDIDDTRQHHLTRVRAQVRGSRAETSKQRRSGTVAYRPRPLTSKDPTSCFSEAAKNSPRHSPRQRAAERRLRELTHKWSKEQPELAGKAPDARRRNSQGTTSRTRRGSKNGVLNNFASSSRCTPSPTRLGRRSPCYDPTDSTQRSRRNSGSRNSSKNSGSSSNHSSNHSSNRSTSGSTSSSASSKNPDQSTSNCGAKSSDNRAQYSKMYEDDGEENDRIWRRKASPRTESVAGQQRARGKPSWQHDFFFRAFEEEQDRQRKKEEAEWKERQQQHQHQKKRPQLGGGRANAANGSALLTKVASRKWGLEQARTIAAQHQQRWERFRASPPDCVTYHDVPWIPDTPRDCPPKDLLLLIMGLDAMVKLREQQRQQLEGVPGCDTRTNPQCSSSDQKAAYRAAVLRWHPDKFLQTFGARLDPHAREKILRQVKSTAQRVTALKTDLRC